MQREVIMPQARLKARSISMIFALCLSVIFIASCAGGGDSSKNPSETADGTVAISCPTAEDSANETQFIPLATLISKEVFPDQLVLSFYSDPAKVSAQSYAKLSGVIIGRYNLALFSLGNSSCTRKIGEKIGNYVLVKIEKDSVLLSKCSDG